MTEARLGYGTLLQRWVDPSWVTVAEQVEIGGPSFDSEDVDVTNHDSPGGSKEYIAGLIDVGEVPFNGNFLPGNITQQRLISDQKDRIVNDWRIVMPDADDIDNRTKWTFDGYVKGLDFSYPAASQMTITGSLKLAGEATLASEYAAALSALAVNGSTSGALAPSPALSLGDTFEYAYIADNADIHATVMPTSTADSIYVNAVEVDSASTSDEISLDEGNNYITVKTVESDMTPRMYSLNVVREST